MAIPFAPDALTISGFFSDEVTWAEIERQWSNVNARYSVQCFHATAPNHGKEEYEGWPKEKRVGYSAELLAILTDQGKHLVAYNCGIRSDAYRRIISDDGQRKLGSPWFVCFKSCIAMIAKHMATLPVADSFSVIVETGSGFDTRQIIRNSNNYAEGFFGENTLENMKASIESANCGAGELVVIPEL